MREEGEVPSSTNLHPIPALIRSSTSSLPPLPSLPHRWLKNSPFPNPLLALSHLSCLPAFSCRRPPRSSISAVCVWQTDDQFPLLAVFSWYWNVDEPWTRMAMVGNDMDGIESTIALPMILPPSQISSCWAEFATRTDCMESKTDLLGNLGCRLMAAYLLSNIIDL